jgi:hypothetical protein
MADVAKLEARIAKLESEIKKLKGDLGEINEDAAISLEENINKLQSAHDIQSKISDLKGEIVDAEKTNLELNEKQLKAASDAMNIMLQKQATLGVLTKEEQELLDLAEQKVKELSKDLKLNEAKVKVKEEENKKSERGINLAIKMGAALGLAAKYEESRLGSMTSTLDTLRTSTKAQEEFKKQLKETFKISNMFSSVWSKILESTVANALAYDSAASSFNAATGAAGEYNIAIEDAARGQSRLGIGMTESGAAMGALHANMSSFTNLSKGTAATLAQGTAALEKLGISGATTAKSMDLLRRNMGMTAEDAMEQQKNLAEFAKGIGVAPAKMAEDFAAAAPKLAVYGKEGLKVFNNLAKSAKATGIEMQALLGITEQFDTFEGAAQAAGKLNALLGGPMLSSVEMLTASDDERVKMMQEAVAMSGKSWESMNKYEQKSIAAALGISDLSEAGRLFGENQEEVAQKQADLNKMIEKSQAVTDKLKHAMMSLAVKMGPYIDDFSNAITTMATWIDKNEEGVQTIGKIILAIGVAIVVWKALLAVLALTKTVMTISALATGSLAGANTALAGSAAPATAGITAMGAAMKKGAVGFIAFGFAALLVGAGVALAALGVAELVKAFAGLTPEQIMGAVAALAIFSLTILGLGIILGVLVYTGVLPIAALGMLALGAAALMMGAGVLLAAKGISEIVKSFSPLVASAAAFPIIGAGFVTMAAGIGALAAALAFIKTEDIVALGELGKAMSNMTVERSVAFRASLEGFESVLDTADNVGIPVMAGAASVVKSATGATTAPAGGGGTTTRGAGPTTVKLILNDREFAKAVINVMENKMNLRTA